MFAGTCVASHSGTGARVQNKVLNMDAADASLSGAKQIQFSPGEAPTTESLVRDLTVLFQSIGFVERGVHAVWDELKSRGVSSAGSRLVVEHLGLDVRDQVSDAGHAVDLEHCSGSAKVKKKTDRTRRWEQEMSSMPDVDGQCYLHVIRWGKRNVFLRALKQSPRIGDFVSMLMPGDLLREVANEFGMFLISDDSTAVGTVYHIAKQCDEGTYLGTVWDCIAAYLRESPGVNRAIDCVSQNKIAAPVDGLVGATTELLEHIASIPPPFSVYDYIPAMVSYFQTDGYDFERARDEVAEVMFGDVERLRNSIYVFPEQVGVVGHTDDERVVDGQVHCVCEDPSLMVFDNFHGRAVVDDVELNHQHVGTFSVLLPPGARVMLEPATYGGSSAVSGFPLTYGQYEVMRVRVLVDSSCNYLVVRPGTASGHEPLKAILHEGQNTLPAREVLNVKLKDGVIAVSCDSAAVLVDRTCLVPSGRQVGVADTRAGAIYPLSVEGGVGSFHVLHVNVPSITDYSLALNELPLVSAMFNEASVPDKEVRLDLGQLYTGKLAHMDFPVCVFPRTYGSDQAVGGSAVGQYVTKAPAMMWFDMSGGVVDIGGVRFDMRSDRYDCMMAVVPEGVGVSRRGLVDGDAGYTFKCDLTSVQYGALHARLLGGADHNFPVVSACGFLEFDQPVKAVLNEGKNALTCGVQYGVKVLSRLVVVKSQTVRLCIGRKITVPSMLAIGVVDYEPGFQFTVNLRGEGDAFVDLLN